MKISKITRRLMNKSLGIDVDGDNQFRLLMTYFNAKQLGDIKLYRTKRGYHIRVSVKTNVFDRAGLGDDKDRLYLSEVRGGDDVLFEYKEFMGKGSWVEELDSCFILSLPFWWFSGRPVRGKRLRRRCKYMPRRKIK